MLALTDRRRPDRPEDIRNSGFGGGRSSDLEPRFEGSVGYILGAPVTCTGRDMASSHRDLGLQPSDMGALVENLQIAMSEEGVAFAAQNRFLAKLAPMRRDVVTR